ncbi:MAG TPA: Plug domain-containing protein [Bacteroidaceae bacterium]|nr:Plug domain-containing protein [Bacteroidaceae bacterium]
MQYRLFMALNRTLTLLGLLSISSIIATAQNHKALAPDYHYTGQVINQASRKGLDYACVSLLSKDSLAIGFGYTKSDGTFDVSVQKRPSYVAATLLGYGKKLIPIEQFNKGKHVIVMATKSFKIREVKISAKRVQIKKDTLVYSVSGFRMQQDKNIEDVLKKMPGIEVASTGTILYQGRAINRFYIEGMNLLGGQYTVGSRNIKPDMVKNVEVIRHHQPIKALRNSTFSEQAALNLILKDQYTMKWVGHAEIGGGTIKKEKDTKIAYRNKLLTMMFNNWQQNLTMYKNDRTGVNLWEELSMKIWSPRLLIEAEAPTRPLVKLSAIAKPNLDQSHYLMNQSHMLTTNHLFKLSKNDNLRIQACYLQDKNDLKETAQTDYYDNNSIYTIHEGVSSLEKEKYIEGKVNYEHNGDIWYIKNDFSGMYDKIENSALIQTNNTHNALEGKYSRTVWKEKFECIYNTTNKKTFKINGDMQYWDFPQNISLITEENQHTSEQGFTANMYTGFKHKIGGFYVNYDAGATFINEKLHNTIIKVNNTQSNTFVQECLYVNPSIMRKTHDYTIRLCGLFTGYHTDIENANNESKTKTRWYVHPRIFGSWQVDGYNTLSASYSLNYRINTLRQTFSMPLYTNYRTQSSYSNDNTANQSQSVYAKYEYDNPMAGFFTYLKFSMSEQTNDYIMERSFADNIVYLHARPDNYHTNNWSIEARINQSLGFWKTNLSVKPRFSSRNYALLIDDVKQDEETDMTSCELGLTVQPNRWINLDLYSTYSKYESKLNGSYSIEDWHYKGELNITPFEGLNVTIGADAYHNTDKSIKDCSFMHIKCDYEWKSWNVAFEIQNVMNKKKYTRQYFNALYQTTQTTNLRPRTCVLSCGFSF